MCFFSDVVGFEPLSHTVIEDVGTFPVCVILQDPAGTNDVLQVQIMAQGSSRPATAVGKFNRSQYGALRWLSIS